MTQIPATIDLNPSGDKPKASIIWLHGLGADGNDFVPIAEQLQFQETPLRFVFPHAPIRPISINNGMAMRAWYDIIEINLEAKEDLEGIQSSSTLIELLIEREMAMGMKPEHIILAGFSQGGAIALYSGLRTQKILGGIIALSGYLPMANTLNVERSQENKNIPIFMAHGLFDPVVPLVLGEMSRQQLVNLNYQLEWHTYSMSHTVIPQEIIDIRQFIHKVVSNIFNKI